jgi:hypothetical protein
LCVSALKLIPQTSLGRPSKELPELVDNGDADDEPEPDKGPALQEHMTSKQEFNRWRGQFSSNVKCARELYTERRVSE